MSPVTPLPRVFRATDGSVAVQVVNRFQEDVYELVVAGAEMARTGLGCGRLVPGEALRPYGQPGWHEMVRDPRSLL